MKLNPSIHQTVLSSITKFFAFYSLPLLSGFLIGTSYIPFPPWALFFCYVPLWLFALRHQKISFLLKGGWLCQFVISLIGFNWLIYSIKELILSSWLSSFFAFLIFCGFANLQIPVALLFWLISKQLLKKSISSFSALLLLPLCFALSAEYYPMIFDWHLGYTWFYAKWPASQTAEIWGFQFLNTLTLFFNLLFLLIFQNLKKEIGTSRFSLRIFLIKLKKLEPLFLFKKFLAQNKLTSLSNTLRQRKNIFIPLFFGIALFIALNLYGLYLKQRWPEPDTKITVLITQPNIANDRQDNEEWSEFILSKILQETVKHLWIHSDEKSSAVQKHSEREKLIVNQNFEEKNSPSTERIHSSKTLTEHKRSIPVDFILWPEGAYPYPVDKLKIIKKGDHIQKWASVFNTPLIASAKGKNKLENTNSIFSFDQYGYLIQPPYDKTALMPFAEYIPLEKWFPSLGNLFFEEKTFTPGAGDNKIINLDGHQLGLQICYESLFDWFTRDLTRKGADILLNVTNDSWFGKWQEPWQHLYMAAARSIEARRPLIRGTNSGFSAVVSAKGDISSPWILNQTLSWIQEVPYLKGEKRQSFFTGWGYYLNQVFLWVLLIFIYCLFWIPLNLKNKF